MRRVLIIMASITVIVIILGIIALPYLPFNFDDSEYTNGYELENAFPNLEFDLIVDLQYASENDDSLFVVQQTGEIYRFENEASASESILFLDLSDQVVCCGERGLLGLAFHPDFDTNGLFYVDYTTGSPLTTRISQFETESNGLADPDSEIVLLEQEQPFSNHNAGSIAFGPDGYLYITMGDGGSGGDPQGNGQNLNTLLGSILRIDIDNQGDGKNYAIPSDNPFVDTDGRDEIFAYGLRNPWKISFDRETGDLWAGDVGQSTYEEVDLIVAGGNYGWNVMEADDCYNSNSCNQEGLELPLAQYGRNEGKSITGGYVYRGDTIEGLYGHYIYGDYLTGRIWSFDTSDLDNVEVQDLMKYNYNLSSFGQDQDGEILVLDYSGGTIYHIVEE